MNTIRPTQELLERVTGVLALSYEDLLYRGILAATSERLFALKQVGGYLQRKYGSLEELGDRIRREGVSADDHTLYNDMLEWRAINHELTELLAVLDGL